jgi:hypothetical protein
MPHDPTFDAAMRNLYDEAQQKLAQLEKTSATEREIARARREVEMYREPERKKKVK